MICGNPDDAPGRKGATRKIPCRFPVCPPPSVAQIRLVPRLSPLLALSVATAAAALGAGDDLSRFSEVAIKPATVYIYVGTVTMTIPPFVRHDAVYSSTYAARVFPFFYTEKGRIWIEIPDDDLRRIANGEAIDFKGHAINEDGYGRRVEGHAIPTDKSGGSIRVRVFVSKRISLTYDTTYELTGAETFRSGIMPK
jgi:hypothetical protein